MKSLFKSAAIFVALAAGSVSAAPKLAIVIDDLGYAKWPVDRAVSLPAHVSLAVFPGLPLSREAAEKAHANGHEVIVHLPMQPRGGQKLNPGTLTTSMSETAFLTQMMAHLQSVPYAVGASNHMGSALTADRGAMTLTMSTLKSWGNLYFVDSRTSKDTVAESVATEMGVPATRRDVFIDNDQNPAAIRKALLKAVDKAKKNGFAVAVGHPTANTISVLEDEIPLLLAEGVQLVSISALIAARSGVAPVVKAKAVVKAKPAVAKRKKAAKPVANSTPSPDFETAADISAEGVIYSETGSAKAFLDNIPLAKTYPVDTPAPGE